jgi:hypothetical protein
VWRDGAGAPVAYGHDDGPFHWVHVVGVGAFRFLPDDDEVLAYPDVGVATDLVEDTFRRTVVPLALQARGHEVLHASAVRCPTGVVAVCAVSGTGKSTVAYALARRGRPLWADDAVCFEVGQEGVRAVPLAFSARLRPASADHFGAPANGEIVTPAPAPLAAVVVLARSGSPEPRVARLTAAEAFPETLTHGYSYRPDDPERTGRMVEAYLALVDAVPVYRLTFAPGLERLDAMLDVIEAALDGGSAAS